MAAMRSSSACCFFSPRPARPVKPDSDFAAWSPAAAPRRSGVALRYHQIARRVPAMKAASRVMPEPGYALFALINDVSVAICFPASFVTAVGIGFFFAITDGFDLLVLHAEQVHHLLHCYGTTLTQRQVVFTRTALIGIALQENPGIGMCPVSYTHLRAHETDSY